MSERYLNYQQAAEYLAVPVGTLRSLVCHKRIPHVRISPRKVTFDRDALDRWIDERASVSEPPHPSSASAAPVLALATSRIPSQLHEDAIGHVASGLPRKAFPRALRDIGVETPPDQQVRPDAYGVDAERRLITVYEVEHRHPISKAKLRRLQWLRDRLSGVGWSLRLIGCAAIDAVGAELDIDTGDLSTNELRSIVETMPGSWFTYDA